ncbi:hypothetical protein [Nautilia lithotrophica]
MKKEVNIYYTFGIIRKNIILKPSKKNTILFLASGKIPTYWKIENAKEANLKAVIFSGKDIKVDTDKSDVIRIRIKYLPRVYKIPSSSDCTYYAPIGIMCKDDSFNNFFKLLKKVQNITGKKLNGFSPSLSSDIYNEQKVIMPSIFLDEKVIKDLFNLKEKIVKKEKNINKIKNEPFYKSNKKLWSEIFNINKQQIPVNKFRAFYIDMEKPKKVIFSEIVKRPDILYSHKNFHGIRADNFMAFWIGDFIFEKDVTKNLSLYVSWGKVKLFIDKKLIYNGKKSILIPYKFYRGKHNIEIEYINNYGQVDFFFNMLNIDRSVDKTFKKLLTPNTKIYLVSINNGNNNHLVNLITKKNKNKKIILFLTSIHPIIWNIVNDDNIKAIVYNSYYPGSFVKVNNKRIKIYYDKNLSYVSRIIPYCHKDLNCENKENFKKVVKHIFELTGKKPDGFSSIYEQSFTTKMLKKSFKGDYIFVPQIKLDEKTYNKIDDILKQLK